mgnify:FL=1
MNITRIAYIAISIPKNTPPSTIITIFTIKDTFPVGMWKYLFIIWKRISIPPVENPVLYINPFADPNSTAAIIAVNTNESKCKLAAICVQKPLVIDTKNG